MGIKKSSAKHEEVIKIGSARLGAFLEVPEAARGIVVFAHGSGSGRHSPRNQYVAKCLQDQKFATLLMDLLTLEEEEVDNLTRELRFNIPFLAERLEQVTEWILGKDKIKNLPIGYFGASTGAAAALIAAAHQKSTVKAIVSRGGRPDLAGNSLPQVVSPTLLIVGGRDFGVIELNQQAFALLSCPKKLEVIPGATHLFEEPGTLEEVARLAGHWFDQYF